MHQDVLISTATKNNWKRLNFKQEEIKSKLTKRANKRFSTKTIIPVEYFCNRNNLTILQEILSLESDTETCIYTLALNLLKANGLLSNKNEFVEQTLNEFGSNKTNPKLLNIKLPTDERDFLGIVYQSLLNEGNKNRKGSYYTPQHIIKNLSKNISKKTKYLDPCCGTGSFLLEVADIIDNPTNIFGYDLDKTACFIAKINLFIKFKNIKFCPNIFNKDFLTEDFKDIEFDIIATNPPWGAVPQKKYEKYFTQISSGESFSYFITKSANLLKTDGEMYFILPESILNVKTHKDIREFILNNLEISKIEILGRAFTGVLSKVVILHLKKNNQNKPITILHEGQTKHLCTDFYKKNTNCNFTPIDNKDVEILEKIYSQPHQKLDENSIWAIGIVTGNNAKHISTNPNGEKIYSGKNISKNLITDTDKFILYNRKEFQQVAADNIYRADEKLVYKFISKNLIFAYDNKQRLFLNSVNILIPKLENYNIKTVMVFLNSILFQYIYNKKFNELKILKGNLMELPFPVTPPQIPNDENIFKAFNLTNEEIQYIKKEVE